MDYENKIDYYKELSKIYKIIAECKNTVPSRATYREDDLINYILNLPDKYNKKYNNILMPIEDIVDYRIEIWKANNINLDKVKKYENVVF